MASSTTAPVTAITVGVLALQGAVTEHLRLLAQAAEAMASTSAFTFLEVRTAAELARCDALIIPGGESTAISLAAQRAQLIEPLRSFVKTHRKPTWGTCAGLILLARCTTAAASNPAALIGGLDVCVERNHFGRQRESFEALLELPFLQQRHLRGDEKRAAPFRAVFIRAPVVDAVVSGDVCDGEAVGESPEQVEVAPVEVLARLPGKGASLRVEKGNVVEAGLGAIVAVRQGNVFGTSFHPELTGDARIHVWWLEQVVDAFDSSRSL